MKYLFQNTGFIIGFWGGIIVLLILNFVLSSTTNILSNIATDYGFPFLAYRTNLSSNYSTYVFWPGLIADIATALVISFVIGIGLKSIWSTFNRRKLR
jgi:hypothetical protein